MVVRAEVVLAVTAVEFDGSMSFLFHLLFRHCPKKSILEARVSSVLLSHEDEHPVEVSLGRRCTFVLTSLGRVFSFGTSEEGMLGLGYRITEAQEPAVIPFSREEAIRSISAGACHVLATTDQGTVYAWGDKFLAGFTDADGTDLAMGNVEEGDDHHHQVDNSTIQWTPKHLEFSHNTDPAYEQRNGNFDNGEIADAFAGYDSSVFVTETGRVLSSGRTSGRLGLGEVQDHVHVPRPMYGGLRLWQEHSTVKRDSMANLPFPSSTAVTGKLLQRGLTTPL